ncbi:MAG: ferritin-like domain-containing protein [Bacteroidota bacterium]|nr:ferritin-like domain-containing protein [Bacteroidota bacterium]
MRHTTTKAGNAKAKKTNRGRGNAPGPRVQQSEDGRRPQADSRQGKPAKNERSGEPLLEKFFLDQLKDIYYAEQKIAQSLPKMRQSATTEILQDAFEDHLLQTERHVRRLEKIFQTLGKKPEGKVCEAIEGIIREAETIIKETEAGTMTRDAALIIAAQKVEHYEIATYGGLVQLAITMRLDAAAELLDMTLVEEEDTDAILTEIAENEINLCAEHEGNEYSWEQVTIMTTD